MTIAFNILCCNELLYVNSLIFFVIINSFQQMSYLQTYEFLKPLYQLAYMLQADFITWDDTTKTLKANKGFSAWYKQIIVGIVYGLACAEASPKIRNSQELSYKDIIYTLDCVFSASFIFSVWIYSYHMQDKFLEIFGIISEIDNAFVRANIKISGRKLDNVSTYITYYLIVFVMVTGPIVTILYVGEAFRKSILIKYPMAIYAILKVYFYIYTKL